MNRFSLTILIFHENCSDGLNDFLSNITESFVKQI